MTQDLHDLEQDIAKSRARLDSTIDSLQGKMSISGVVDDVIGTIRVSSYGSIVDRALETIRHNPFPVMLIAAGFGLLAYQYGRRSSMQRGLPRVSRVQNYADEQNRMPKPESRPDGGDMSPLPVAREAALRRANTRV